MNRDNLFNPYGLVMPTRVGIMGEENQAFVLFIYR